MRSRKMAKKRQHKKVPKHFALIGVQPAEWTRWLRERNKPMDDQQYDIRSILRLLFDCLDMNKEGVLEEPDVMSMERYLTLSAPGRNLQAAFRVVAKKFGPRLGFNEFLALVRKLQLTNQEFRDLSRAVLWAPEEKKFTVSDIPAEGVQQTLHILQEKWSEALELLFFFFSRQTAKAACLLLAGSNRNPQEKILRSFRQRR